MVGNFITTKRLSADKTKQTSVSCQCLRPSFSNMFPERFQKHPVPDYRSTAWDLLHTSSLAALGWQSPTVNIFAPNTPTYLISQKVLWLVWCVCSGDYLEARCPSPVELAINLCWQPILSLIIHSTTILFPMKQRDYSRT